MIDIVVPGRSDMYDRIVQPLAEHIQDAELRVGAPSDDADLVYYGNYGLTQAHDVPVVTLFTHREPPDHPHSGMRMLSGAWDHAVECSDKCIAMSEAFLDYLPADKTEVIYPGIHPATYGLNKLRVGVAGQEYDRNRYRKGYDLVQQLEDEHHAWLDIQRTDGTLNLAQYAFWLRRLHVYLVSSRYEGGPMAPIEALALGVPVVTSNVGFMETVNTFAANTNLINVVMYQAGDYDDLVNVLYGLYSERARFNSMFSLTRWINMHRRVFEDLL